MFGKINSLLGWVCGISLVILNSIRGDFGFFYILGWVLIIANVILTGWGISLRQNDRNDNLTVDKDDTVADTSVVSDPVEDPEPKLIPLDDKRKVNWEGEDNEKS